MSRRAPPVALLALAHAAGAVPVHLGAAFPVALALPAALLLPIPLWRRPVVAVALLASATSGALGAAAHGRADLRDCRRALPDDVPLTWTGRLAGPPLGGRGVLVPEPGGGPALQGGCDLPVSVALPSARGSRVDPPPAGALLEVRGRWRSTPGARSSAWAGTLRVEAWAPAPAPRRASPAALRVRLGAAGAERLHRSFGDRGPLASALVLSRAEGMDPDLRAAFARSGIAHLLSVSGFHVGVVAGIAFAVLRLAGAGAAARLGALPAVWGYVALLGAPDASVRAALLLTLLALGRAGGRPLSGEGALASAYLGVALLDPGAPGRIGFQLSFAGAAGLVRLAPPLERWLARSTPSLPRAIRSPVASGAGATLATLPIAAWHFEQVSLVGIPGTLIAGPLASAGIAGLLLVLVLGAGSERLADFVAGGTDVILGLLVRVVEAFSAPAWAALAVPRGWVLVGGVGWLISGLALRGASGLGRGARTAVLAAGAAGAVLLAPPSRALGERGTIAVEALDVGQGDAVLIRSPAGRWVLVDAGPRSDRWDAGERVVVPALRRRGVRRLEAMVLTHPHLDHVGGAAAVLRSVPVGVVLDPGWPFGTGGFVEALEAAEARRVAWASTRRGVALELDGLRIEVLHPDRGEAAGAAPGTDPNDLSVVLLLRYGAFRALLTGDAPRAVEESLGLPDEPIQLLKVGHHGSETSSSSELLALIRPEVALVSAGRGNQFGHPHRSALNRLEAAGARVHRTDREGTLRIRAREDGSWTLFAEHPD